MLDRLNAFNAKARARVQRHQLRRVPEAAPRSQFALPALLFRTIAIANLYDADWGIIGASLTLKIITGVAMAAYAWATRSKFGPPVERTLVWHSVLTFPKCAPRCAHRVLLVHRCSRIPAALFASRSYSTCPCASVRNVACAAARRTAMHSAQRNAVRMLAVDHAGARCCPLALTCAPPLLPSPQLSSAARCCPPSSTRPR